MYFLLYSRLGLNPFETTKTFLYVGKKAVGNYQYMFSLTGLGVAAEAM